jgi:DNA invertase Pin-like site-specific DNA recombinase
LNRHAKKPVGDFFGVVHAVERNLYRERRRRRRQRKGLRKKEDWSGSATKSGEQKEK